MGWEQDITELLDDLQSISVRYDIEQELTTTEKTRARNNISVGATATIISGDDYKIILH